MPFFNGAAVIKKLWNIINVFSENGENWMDVLSTGYSHCTIDIKTKYKMVF